jgi:hypothetical protein
LSVSVFEIEEFSSQDECMRVAPECSTWVEPQKISNE